MSGGLTAWKVSGGNVVWEIVMNFRRDREDEGRKGRLSDDEDLSLCTVGVS